MSDEVVRPVRTDVNRGFWEGADDGELRVQRCGECSELRYPPSPRCPHCLSAESTWQAVSGHGEVLSYVVIHQRYHPAWADRVPYNVALVQLDEGPRMMSNVLPLSRPDVRVGMPVRVVFDDEDGMKVPRFVDAGDGAASTATEGDVR